MTKAEALKKVETLRDTIDILKEKSTRQLEINRVLRNGIYLISDKFKDGEKNEFIYTVLEMMTKQLTTFETLDKLKDGNNG